MLNDFQRNSGYWEAISSAVGASPGCTVLDIGAGTGILRSVGALGDLVHDVPVPLYFLSSNSLFFFFVTVSFASQHDGGTSWGRRGVCV